MNDKITEDKTFINKENFPKLGDPDFDSMRPDKTKIPLPSKRSRKIVDFYTAVKMMSCFCYRRWMSHRDVVGPNGERIASNGEIYIPKFRRK